jgi:hypothetical protein
MSTNTTIDSQSINNIATMPPRARARGSALESPLTPEDTKNIDDSSMLFSRSLFLPDQLFRSLDVPAARSGEQRGTAPSWLGNLAVGEDLSGDQIKAQSRALCRRIPPEEAQKIRRDRQRLILKEVRTGRLDAYEAVQLQMLEWHLDRIGDAKLGPHIDNLERFVEEDKRIGKEIDRFLDALDSKIREYRAKNKPQRRRR